MSLDYATVKLVHRSAVGAFGERVRRSRGGKLHPGHTGSTARAAKTLPHVVDTVLLLSRVDARLDAPLTPANAPG
jgi:uncharacterized membrane protein SirB2